MTEREKVDVYRDVYKDRGRSLGIVLPVIKPIIHKPIDDKYANSPLLKHSLAKVKRNAIRQHM